jgi:hypothetical protein
VPAGAMDHHPACEGEHPYVFLDRIVLKRSWAGKVRNVSLLSTASITESERLAAALKFTGAR